MLRYNQVIYWIENNFTVDEIEELEYTDFEMESDISFYRKEYSVPAKFNWTGERISFKDIHFFFKNKDLIGYYKDNQFIEKSCILDWNLCDFYNIPYVNPFEVVENKWGVLKHKPTNLYVGIETPIGNFLEKNIYQANIIGSVEWNRFQKMGGQYFSESIADPYYIDNEDLEFIEIEIVIKK
jgi:hypothetical protein